MRKAIVFIVMLMSVLMVSASAPQPEYIPYCSNPQQIAPMQMAGNGGISPVVWNGKDYATAWIEGGTTAKLYFRRLFADGTPAAAPVQVASGSTLVSPPALVWNGSGYGLAYRKYNGTYMASYFCRVDQNGNIIGGEVQVSSYNAGVMESYSGPNLAWSGTGYAVVWGDVRSGPPQIYVTLLDPAGSITFGDTPIETTSFPQTGPSIAWAPVSSAYQVVWLDSRSGTKSEIYGAQIFEDNTVMNINLLVSSPAGSGANYPSLAASPNGCGLSWMDMRDGNTELYFALLSSYGTKWTSDVRLTNDPGDKYDPVCVWNGIEYGIFWEGRLTADLYAAMFQRVSGIGAAQGGNMQVTQVGNVHSPKAAFAHYGYLITASNDANFVEPWGCNSAGAPGCPSNLLAYGVSGSTATIAWQAALDNYTDIAYYAVYRNNAEIAKTSNTYYTDTGLGLNTTYNYTVRAVNAAQYMNDPQTCGATQPQSVYVKTNASFTLLLDKSADPDAHLYWNDGGMNSYNIYRGTSPQVMSLIGTTSGQSADDNNVLMDTNTYFYTVDDPGQ